MKQTGGRIVRAIDKKWDRRRDRVPLSLWPRDTTYRQVKPTHYKHERACYPQRIWPSPQRGYLGRRSGKSTNRASAVDWGWRRKKPLSHKMSGSSTWCIRLSSMS